MSANFSTNLVNALNERITDLAQANDPEVVKTVLQDAQVSARAQTDPPAYYGDRCVYRITVAVLGLAVILVVIAQFALAYRFANAAEIPDGIIAIGSAAIGALAGLLAPTQTAPNGDPPPGK
jgi:uncharacterized integral membrane protein